jgi:hypothetical protein
MTPPTRHHAPWILWPFAALWDLLAFVLRITGRLLALVLGAILMMLGIGLTLTVVGAPLGVPVAILGFLLLVRSLF